MEGGVRGDGLRRESQGKETSNVASLVRENTDAAERLKASLVSKCLWWVVWGAMALLASVNALEPYGILSGKAGLVGCILLAALATAQLVMGGSGLSGKEFALAKVVLVLFAAGLFGQRVHMNPVGVDFSAYYVAGHLAAERPPGRLYYQAVFPDGRFNVAAAASGWHEETLRYGTADPPPFIYPPFFAVLMKPFVYFSYRVASGLWSSLTVLLTFISVLMTFRLGGRRINAQLAPILVTGLFSYAPFFHELAVGQVSSLLLFLFVLGLRLLSRNRDWLSAFCFAVATMIKLTPTIAVPLLAMHRKWKWLAAYGCWMVGLLGFSVWQAGLGAHEQFWHTVVPSLSCGLDTYGNTSIMAFVQEVFLGRMPMDGIPSALPTGACLASKVTAFAVLTLLMLRFYRYRMEENLVLHLGLLLLVSLPISPIAWIHHYVIALLPFLYLWCREREPGTDHLLLATVLAVGTCVTAFPLPLIVHNHAAQLVIAAVVPCSMIALVYSRVSGERLEGSFQGA
jgi:Glycosyltransferase family 87